METVIHTAESKNALHQKFYHKQNNDELMNTKLGDSDWGSRHLFVCATYGNKMAVAAIRTFPACQKSNHIIIHFHFRVS